MRARALADLLIARFEPSAVTVEGGFYVSTQPSTFRFRENGQRLLFEGTMASDLAGELGLSVRDLSELQRGNPSTDPPPPAAAEPEPATPAAEPSEHRQNAIDAVTEALLDNIVEADDPWTYLRTITDHEIALEYRHQFYQNFIAMVSLRPQAEQDSLVTAGLSVFKYRAETARKDVDALRATGATKVLISASVLTADFMAEMIYVATPQPSLKYLVYRGTGESESTEIVDQIAVEEVLNLPPQGTHYAQRGKLLLASGIEEYGTDADLFRDLVAYVERWLTVPAADWRDLMVFYALLTWVYDRFDSVPYFRSLGDWGGGKTRLLRVLGSISFRCLMMGGATSLSPVFRALDQFRGTLVIDEADLDRRSDLSSEYIKMLNVGYERDGCVFRSEKNQHDALEGKMFDVYGPKYFSTREQFDDQALESRCLTYNQPVLPDVSVPLDFDDTAREEARVLRNKLLLWRFRHYRTIVPNPAARIPGIELRVQQIVRPLLSIQSDETLRGKIMGIAHDVAASQREGRRGQLEGQIVEAMVVLRIESEDQGYWSVAQVTERVNQGQRPHFHQSPKKIGRKMKALLGHRSREYGNRNTVGYEFKIDALRRLSKLYGCSLRRPVK